MAAIGGEGDRTNIDLKSVAVAIAPEKGRAPVIKTDANKDIPDLNERMIKLGGKSVFEADLAQNENDLMVNFDEMRRVLDAEQKKVDGENDANKKADLQKRFDRLSRRFNVYDKLLNNEGFDAMNTEEKREMVKVVGGLPGFCESAVLATGGRITAEQMQNILSGRGGTALTSNEAKIVGEMITRMVDDPKFHNRLSKNLSALTLDTEDSVKSQELADLRDTVKDEAAKKVTQAGYKTIIDAFESKTEAEKNRINKVGADTARLLNSVEEVYKPSTFTLPEITLKEGELVGVLAQAVAAQTAAAGGGGGSQTEQARVAQVQTELAAIRALKNIFTPTTATADYLDFDKITDTRTKKTGIDGELKAMEKSKGTIAKLEGERSKYADKYKRKMELALSEEMKRYWNEVILIKASTAAEAQAQKKAEGEKEAADHKENQKKLAKEVLDKYLQLSFLKYENGKAVGWDDKAIKQFVKTDMLSRSPEQLTKDLLTRVYSGRMSMPKDYGDDLKRIIKEMGVGEGQPPLTLKGMLNQIDREEWNKMAAEKIPDVLGYGWARGYYFDRMQLKPAQAEFMQRAYGEDFFVNALQNKAKYADEAAQLLGADFMDGGVVSREKIKQMLFGKDWTQGSKKLMKAVAIAGAGYVLGGGLAWGVGSKAALAMGADQVGANIKAIGTVGLGALTGVSKLSNVALHNTIGNYTIAAGGSVITPEVPAVIGPGGAIITPAIPAVLSQAEPSKAGGLIGVLDKLAGKVNAVSGPTPAP